MPPAAFCRSFFVAPPPSGRDNGAGTTADPVSTIPAGIAKCTADGDTCYVRAGTYRPTSSIGIWGLNAAAGSHRVLKVWPADSGLVIVNGDTVQGTSTRSTFVIGSDGWTIEGFEVINGLTAGIQGWDCNRATVRNNHVHDCPGAGIALFWSDHANLNDGNVIEGNTVHDCAQTNAGYTATSWGAGIALQNNRNGAVRRNRVYRIHGEGILSYQSQSIVYADNVVYDTYATNYYLDGNTDCTVERNIGYQTHDPAFFPANPPNNIRPHNGIQLGVENYGIGQTTQLANNIIRNNIIVGAMHGLYYGSYSLGGGMTNCVVANNTFCNCQSASIHIDEDAHQGNRIANNILLQDGGGFFLTASSNVTGFSFDHNGFFGPTPPASIRGDGDVTGAYSAVGLADPGTYRAADYRLAAGSPCIGAGADLSMLVAEDFAANARSAPWDLGAWKYSGPTPVARTSRHPFHPAAAAPLLRISGWGRLVDTPRRSYDPGGRSPVVGNSPPR